MTIEEAVEVFVRGFAFGRSATHPYLVERIHPGIWKLADAPRRSGDYRSEEYVAFGVAAAEVDAAARDRTRGHYKVCMLRGREQPDGPIRVEFRALKYRLMATEEFFVHHLAALEPVTEPYPVHRVTTPEQAQLLAKATRRRPLRPEQLAEPSPLRQYLAVDGDAAIGWVGSVAAAASAWCTNMYVEPAYRRRGVARSLMTRMLLDDRAAGAKANVLLASHAGSKLYPTVGYESIGELLMYSPPRRSAGG